MTSNVKTIVPQSLDVLTVGVRDVAATRRFYEGWGWQATPMSTPEWVSFDIGSGRMVAFFDVNALVHEAAPGAAAPAAGSFSGVTLAVILPEKTDVDSTWRAAIDAGATAVGQPEDRVWGGRSGYVADPEGNRWEIVWMPPMPAQETK